MIKQKKIIVTPKLISLIFSVLILCFATVSLSVAAWTTPTENPPGGNAPVPINVSTNYQTKTGPLILNTDNYPTGLIVAAGNVGIGSTANPEFKLSLDNDGGIIAKGTQQSGTGAILTTSGAGTRLIWYPEKSAFRAGTVIGNEWNNTNIGVFSTATGLSTTASGYASTSFGLNTIASGQTSIATGENSVASAIDSTAMGYYTTASGINSTAIGTKTIASGEHSTAMGGFTTASGYGSTSMGNQTIASGKFSTTMGDQTIASAIDSTAIGFHTTASGFYSTAIGSYNTANGINSIVIGQGVANEQRLINDKNLSLMVGFNSTIPTLFVGPASGPNSIGSVGIGTTSFQYIEEKFEVNGVSNLKGGLIIPVGEPETKRKGQIWLDDSI
jgi:hypothetical protein